MKALGLYAPNPKDSINVWVELILAKFQTPEFQAFNFEI